MGEHIPCFYSQQGCFCELISQGVLVNPVNTWTNVSMIIAGLLVLFFSTRVKEPSEEKKLFTSLIAISLMIAGIGSFWYHATLAHAAQIVDWLGVGMIVFSILVFQSTQGRNFPKIQVILFFLVPIFALLVIVSVGLYMVARVIIPIFFLIIVVKELIGIWYVKDVRGYTRLFSFAIFFAFVSFLVWIFDEARILCDPDGVLQMHALWHVFISVSMILVFLYAMTREVSDAGKIL